MYVSYLIKPSSNNEDLTNISALQEFSYYWSLQYKTCIQLSRILVCISLDSEIDNR